MTRLQKAIDFAKREVKQWPEWARSLDPYGAYPLVRAVACDATRKGFDYPRALQFSSVMATK